MSDDVDETVSKTEYNELKAKFDQLESILVPSTVAVVEMTPVEKFKTTWWWFAPEYFSRWRLFPRAFISMYIYLLYKVVVWFMDLPDPNMNQAGLVSVVVGAGAAWFGLYVNSTSTKFDAVSVPVQNQYGITQGAPGATPQITSSPSLAPRLPSK